MIQPVIPLQPRTQEGQGSAFILPDKNRALDILFQEAQQRREEQKQAKRLFYDDLVRLSTAKGRVLPGAESQIEKQKGEMVNWMAETKNSGKNPYDPNGLGYAEARGKMAELEANINRGITGREHYQTLFKLYQANPDKYETDSLEKAAKYFEETPLSEQNVVDYPSLEERFNLQNFQLKFGKTYNPEMEEMPVGPAVQVYDDKGNAVTGSLQQEYARRIKDPNAVVKQYVKTLPENGKEYYQSQIDGLMESDPDGYKRAVDEVVNENATAATDPKVLEKELLKRMAKNDALSQYKQLDNVKRIPKQQPPSNQNLDLDFNGGNNEEKPLDPFDARQDNSFETTITTSVGKTKTPQKRNVVMSPARSFKNVAVQNETYAGAIDVNKNKLIKGVKFDNVDIGRARAVPIAVVNIEDPRTGVKYSAGEFVDSESIKGLTKDGLVEYRPMFAANGKSRDSKDNPITTPMFIPTDGNAEAVVLSQSKDDAPTTKNQIKKAMEDAKSLNSKMSEYFKSKSAPSKGGEKGKAKRIDTSKLTGAALVSARRTNKANGYSN